MIDYLAKFKLNNKIAVVCGGLGLIGKEVSTALAQVGAKVIILDINKKNGKKFEEECRKKKLNIVYQFFDVSNIEVLEKEIREIFTKEGAINIWVNVSYPRTKDWGKRIEDV